MRVLPYRARDNVIDGALVTFVDVTKIVDAEAHQKTLVDELNHRVRNMLTIVGAIANQTLIAHPVPKEFVTAFLGRVQAMARAYTLVSSENWTEVELRDIIGRELEATADGPHHSNPFHLDGPPILFKPSAALALGLVFHELVTNAVKYGALSKPKGKVSVNWGPDGGGAGGPLVIQWKEMDGPEVKEPERRGLGLELIERELNGTLGARAQFDYDKSGLKAKISIPFEGRHFSAARPARPN
jgi:two-component system CheB/CheR fusion protein